MVLVHRRQLLDQGLGRISRCFLNSLTGLVLMPVAGGHHARIISTTGPKRTSPHTHQVDTAWPLHDVSLALGRDPHSSIGL